MRVRAGMIGTGSISRVHLEWMKQREDVEIVALCDVSKKAVAEKAGNYGATAYTNHNDMLRENSLDAVWICTPPTARKGLIQSCVSRGLPVFCEKPAAFDADTATEIARDIEEAEARVMVGYPFRVLPIIKTLKDALRDDTIHGIQSLYLCNVSLTMGLRPWFYDIEKSGGAMVDQATHVFDLLRVLFGEICRVDALGSNPVKPKGAGYTVDEVIGLILAYDSGAVGTHLHSWVGNGWRTQIQMSGEKKFYQLDLTGGGLDIFQGSEKIHHPLTDKQLHSYENDVFIDMVKREDFSENPCTYEDAAKTLALTMECNIKLAG